MGYADNASLSMKLVHVGRFRSLNAVLIHHNNRMGVFF
jgi:hypothetical protein